MPSVKRMSAARVSSEVGGISSSMTWPFPSTIT
ncbi:Uncharacterised protein [Vibrio cholerae]|nr:Uncharacterised protein [Vibrio cholerae]